MHGRKEIFEQRKEAKDKLRRKEYIMKKLGKCSGSLKELKKLEKGIKESMKRLIKIVSSEETF